MKRPVQNKQQMHGDISEVSQVNRTVVNVCGNYGAETSEPYEGKGPRIIDRADNQSVAAALELQVA